MYILCGSEGCNSGAVKWSPDVVSSARWRFGMVQQGKGCREYEIERRCEGVKAKQRK